jgi:hypothetical protein
MTYQWQETAALINLQVSWREALAMNYLERAGFTFLVDFGYRNAIDKALAHWCARKARP